MAAPTIAVVILNWNGKQLLERFLPGIIENTPPGVEIIVADNASTDDSLKTLKEIFPPVRIIALDKNYGFAGGYNRALQQVAADYYVLLNSDMEVTAEWIEPCIRLMESNTEVAACQPKIRSLNNPGYFEYAGAAGGFVDHLGFPFCRGRIFDTLEKDKGQYDDYCDIFWATGASMFIRAAAFHKAGGFDEHFFAHMEEVDLCWRLQNLGYRIMICPRSLVFHLGGGSLPPSSPRKTYLNFRNSLWMLAKNLPGRYLYPRILLRLALDTIAAVKFLSQGQYRDHWAVMKAHMAFFRRFRMMRRKSRQLPETIPAMLYRKSIVIDYFIRGKKCFSDLRFKASKANR